MYWNILVWLRIEIPDGFLHQIPENLKIDDLVTGGTINLQLTLWDYDNDTLPAWPVHQKGTNMMRLTAVLTV